MQKQKILIIEDDVHFAGLISEYLTKNGYDTFIEHDGMDACEKVFQVNPDLIILDLMLPGKDGLSLCRDIRKSFDGPVAILTAKEDDIDQVAGLETGADDYIKKPVEPRVLLARIRALLRRTTGEMKSSISNNDFLQFGDLNIKKTSRIVEFKGKEIDLSTREFDLLCFLAERAGEILSRDSLYEAIWKRAYDGFDRSVDIAVSRLRKKLGDSPEKPFRIKTIWGSGYIFIEDAWKK